MDAMLLDQLAGLFVLAQPPDQVGTNATAVAPIVFRCLCWVIRRPMVRGVSCGVRLCLRLVYFFASPCDFAALRRPDHPQFNWIQILAKLLASEPLEPRERFFRSTRLLRQQ